MHYRLLKKYTCFKDYSRLITLTYRQCLRKTPERRTVYTAIRSRGPETSRRSWRLTQRQASSTSCGRDSLLYSCCLRTPVQVRSWFQHTAVRKSIQLNSHCCHFMCDMHMQILFSNSSSASKRKNSIHVCFNIFFP